MTKTHPINYLLILSIVLLPATKLQINHTPLTLGSILIVMYCFFAFLIGIKITPSLKLFLKLFSILGLCFVAGFIVNLYKLHRINPTTWHDIFAYGFIIVFIVALNCKKVELGKCIKIASISIPIFYLLFIFDLDYWYQHFRFSGLSVNPNQFGLALVGIPLVIIYHYKSSSHLTRLFMIISFILCLMMSYYNATNALFVSWALIITIYAIYQSTKYWCRSTLARVLWILTCLTIIALSLAEFLSLLNYVLSLIHYKNYFSVLLHMNTDLFLRLQLWHKSLELIPKSILVGFGPGSFLHDQTNHSTHYEAHNVFVDLLLQGGVIALITFIVFLLNIFRYSLKNKIQFFLTLAIIIFSCFHYTLRQPILWIYFFWIHRTGYKEATSRQTALQETSSLTDDACVKELEM